MRETEQEVNTAFQLLSIQSSVKGESPPAGDLALPKRPCIWTLFSPQPVLSLPSSGCSPASLHTCVTCTHVFILQNEKADAWTRNAFVSDDPVFRALLEPQWWTWGCGSRSPRPAGPCLWLWAGLGRAAGSTTGIWAPLLWSPSWLNLPEGANSRDADGSK